MSSNPFTDTACLRPSAAAEEEERLRFPSSPTAEAAEAEQSPTSAATPTPSEQGSEPGEVV